MCMYVVVVINVFYGVIVREIFFFFFLALNLKLSRMRSVGEGFSFYFGGLRVETCSLDATSVIVTVCNEVAMAMPMASSAKVVTLGGL